MSSMIFEGILITVRDHKWKWVTKPNSDGKETLRDVGVLADGSLYNPNRYDEQLVRQALRGAFERWKERLSRSAKKAAKTRTHRQELKINQAVTAILARKAIGPRTHCYCCGKSLDDPQSVSRGIGSDCWQEILRRCEAAQAHVASGHQ